MWRGRRRRRHHHRQYHRRSDSPFIWSLRPNVLFFPTFRPSCCCCCWSLRVFLFSFPFRVLFHIWLWLCLWSGDRRPRSSTCSHSQLRQLNGSRSTHYYSSHWLSLNLLLWLHRNNRVIEYVFLFDPNRIAYLIDRGEKKKRNGSLLCDNNIFIITIYERQS